MMNQFSRRVGMAARLAELVLGSIFVVAALAKFITPNQAMQFISTILVQAQSVTRELVYGISAVELLLGIMFFVPGKHLPWICVISSVLLLGFIVLQTVVPSVTSCGCFGKLMDFDDSRINIVRNITLLCFSMFILWADEQQKERTTTRVG